MIAERQYYKFLCEVILGYWVGFVAIHVSGRHSLATDRYSCSRASST